jgi:3',5'-cyclic AMP phosphodiesterase CpdA
MSLLLHISDTHFGTEQAPVVAALVALARRRCPDALVLSGDVTQRARPAQFAAARAFCDHLAISPMLTLPGNHDVPLYNLLVRLWRPYGRYRAAFGRTLEPVIQTEDLLVVGVNTTRWRRHKHGEVSPSQVARVAAQLAQARPGQLRVVVTHQPAAVGREEDEHDRLRGAEPALQAWSSAGADLILGGHIHLPFVLDLQARHPATPRAMWGVQAGTAVSSRIRHGTCNSVNLIEWKAPAAGASRSCTVERWDYSAASGRFETASVTTLALAC